MTIQSANVRIRQVRRTLIGVSITLSVMLLLALTTKAFHLGHEVEASAVAQYTLHSPAGLKPIDEATAARAILGKAPFRVMRRVQEKMVDELGRFELMGGTFSGKSNAMAFVKDTRRNRTIRLRVGDTLGTRYEVVAIDSRGVTLWDGNDEVTLKR